MHLVLVNHSENLSLPRSSVVRLTDCPDMTIAVYHSLEATKQHFSYRHTMYTIPLIVSAFDNGPYHMIFLFFGDSLSFCHHGASLFLVVLNFLFSLIFFCLFS